MTESDWKLLRKLRELALGRLCRDILGEIAVAGAADSTSYHERYLDVFRIIDERNKQMAAAFDDPRRSTGIHQLALMVAGGWLTDEECRQFSDETRSIVQRMVATKQGD